MSEPKLEIKIEADPAEAKAGIKSFEKSLDSLKQESQDALAPLANVDEVVGESFSKAKTEATKDVRAIAAATDKAANEISADMGKAAKATENVGTNAKAAAVGMDDLKKAAATIGVAALAREFLQVNAAIEGTQKALAAVSGSTESAAKDMLYLEQMSDRLGVNFQSLASSFVSFSASAKGTALEGDQARRIFESVTEAASKLGLSTERTDQALVALGQMMGKGVVSAEELRGQLGEALPGAMQAMAKEMGVTVAELGKMVETGTVLAVDALPKLADGLDKAFGGGKGERIDSLTASMERFGNATRRAFTEPGQAGLADAFGRIIDAGTVAISALTGSVVALGKDIGATAAFVTGAIPTWKEYTAAIEENRQAALRLIDGKTELQVLEARRLELLKQYQEQAEETAKAEERAARATGVQAIGAASALESQRNRLRDVGEELADVTGKLGKVQAANADVTSTAKVAADAMAGIGEAAVKSAEQGRKALESLVAGAKGTSEAIDAMNAVLRGEDPDAKKQPELAAMQAQADAAKAALDAADIGAALPIIKAGAEALRAYVEQGGAANNVVTSLAAEFEAMNKTATKAMRGARDPVDAGTRAQTAGMQPTAPAPQRRGGQGTVEWNSPTSGAPVRFEFDRASLAEMLAIRQQIAAPIYVDVVAQIIGGPLLNPGGSPTGAGGAGATPVQPRTAGAGSDLPAGASYPDGTPIDVSREASRQGRQP